jgi:hypothetical protein
MSTLIQNAQVLTAGTGQGRLSQYYGLADTTQTTVVAASSMNLSTPYVIPAGEASYAGAAYELSCAGQGQWGSTQQALTFAMYLGGGTFGSGSAVAATAFSASSNFSWGLVMKLTCADGVSAWWCDLYGTVSLQNSIVPGVAASNSVALASTNSGAHLAAVTSPVTVAVQAKWASVTGTPTITNYWTTFRKVA